VAWRAPEHLAGSTKTGRSRHGAALIGADVYAMDTARTSGRRHPTLSTWRAPGWVCVFGRAVTGAWRSFLYITRPYRGLRHLPRRRTPATLSLPWVSRRGRTDHSRARPDSTRTHSAPHYAPLYSYTWRSHPIWADAGRAAAHAAGGSTAPGLLFAELRAIFHLFTTLAPTTLPVPAMPLYTRCFWFNNVATGRRAVW